MVLKMEVYLVEFLREHPLSLWAFIARKKPGPDFGHINAISAKLYALKRDVPEEAVLLGLLEKVLNYIRKERGPDINFSQLKLDNESPLLSGDSKRELVQRWIVAADAEKE